MNKLSCAILFLSTLLAGALAFSCKKNNTQRQPTPIHFKIPEGFPANVTLFDNNPLTEEGVALGKALFYDGMLSIDGNFPCGSCHQQFAAFATFEHAFSHGFNNSFTTRNAPGLFNLAWVKNFHWDGGVNHLEVQPLTPLTAPNEMSEDVANVIRKLQATAYYPAQFQAAFGTTTITSQFMLKALAQFMGTLVSANSTYDQVKAGKASFTPEQARGYALFQEKQCSSCHTEPLFTDMSYRNTGLTPDPNIQDFGRVHITHNPADSFKFRVPSLRNVEVTFPYGHDGRFSSLNKMLDHYVNGVQFSSTVDPLIRNGIPLTLEEKNAIIAFLLTLTDEQFLQDQRFAAPR